MCNIRDYSVFVTIRYSWVFKYSWLFVNYSWLFQVFVSIRDYSVFVTIRSSNFELRIPRIFGKYSFDISTIRKLYPRVTQSYPLITQTYSRVTQSYFWIAQTYPRVTQSYPRVTKTYPRVTQTLVRRKNMNDKPCNPTAESLKRWITFWLTDFSI